MSGEAFDTVLIPMPLKLKVLRGFQIVLVHSFIYSRVDDAYATVLLLQCEAGVFSLSRVHNYPKISKHLITAQRRKRRGNVKKSACDGTDHPCYFVKNNPAAEIF